MVPIWVALLIFLIFAAIFTVLCLKWFAKGSDGIISVSKVQIILWTGVVLASYLSLALLRGDFLDDVPANLLYLMGISVGSSITASGIRAIQEPILPKDNVITLKRKKITYR